MKRWWGMMLLLGGLLTGSPARAAMEEITGAEAQAIHAVVQQQLDAFEEDDADRAFALSTASTRKLIGSAAEFLRMIKYEYPPIYRHRRALFMAPQRLDGAVLQVVRLTDRDNNVWVAIYSLEVEPDGKWRIDGCSLLETTTVSV